MTLDNISQFVIASLGVTSIVMLARKNKWGFILQLITQPFWYYTTYHHKQWGIFFLNFAYTASWAYGAYEWFIKGESGKQTTKPTKVAK